MACLLGQIFSCPFFNNGEGGFIVLIRDPEVLLTRVQQLGDDLPLQRSMSGVALRRVRNLGGWQQYGDRWVSLLETLLPENRGSKPICY
jgi:alpha-maltose-1-phosphate synthase